MYNLIFMLLSYILCKLYVLRHFCCLCLDYLYSHFLLGVNPEETIFFRGILIEKVTRLDSLRIKLRTKFKFRHKAYEYFVEYSATAFEVNSLFSLIKFEIFCLSSIIRVISIQFLALCLIIDQ